MTQVIGIDDAGLLELFIEIVPFPGALTHATEHGHTTVFLGDVVDQLLNEHGFAHPGATEEAHLAPLAVRGQQVNHLDARFKDAGLGFQVREAGSSAVNGGGPGLVHRTTLVYGRPQHVENAPQGAFTHRDRNGLACSSHPHAPHQAVGAAHGHGPHGAVPQKLLHLAGDRHTLARRVGGFDGQGIVNAGQITRGKLHINDRANDLADGSLGCGRSGGGGHKGGLAGGGRVHGHFITAPL